LESQHKQKPANNLIQPTGDQAGAFFIQPVARRLIKYVETVEKAGFSCNVLFPEGGHKWAFPTDSVCSVQISKILFPDENKIYRTRYKFVID
jgi:hypothetical protein